MPGTMKNTLNNVQEEFGAAIKARKKLLAKHTWMIWDRYVRRILDTRFEVTTKLNFALLDMEMKTDLYDIEIVAPFSFDKDIDVDENIHEKIGTNKYNKFGRSEGEVIQEEEKALSRKSSIQVWS